MKKLKHTGLIVGAVVSLLSLPAVAETAATPAPQPPAKSLEDAFLHGTPTLDARYRYETVDQNGLAHNAHASTLRTRIGYITGTYEGFKAGIELENIARLGPKDFNSTHNGKTTYPVVADPSASDINQLYVSYQCLPKTTITAGRQLINIDNQRFVGAVEWRQNNQTFDAVSLSNQYIDHLSLYYAYVWQVNRVFGDDAPPGANVGEFDSHSHLINVAYEFDPALKVTGYTYLLDLDSPRTAPATPSAGETSSNATYGLRLTGKYGVGSDVKLLYSAEVAHQKDYGDNPANVDENYYLLEPGIAWNGWTAKVGSETLQGNGVTAFQSPLATLHAFNGWADKFLSTPVNGLEDRYGSLGYKVPFGDAWLKGTEATVAYHDFDSNHGSINYGKEWDGSLVQTFFTHYTLGLKIADYNADETSAGNTTTDTKKAMVWMQIRF